MDSRFSILGISDVEQNRIPGSCLYLKERSGGQHLGLLGSLVVANG